MSRTDRTTSGRSPTPLAWIGGGSISILPPADYWMYLAGVAPGPQLDRLVELSDKRLTEFLPSDLPLFESAAVELLNRVAADGWLERKQRKRCPNCDSQISEEEAAQPVCPHCEVAYSELGGVRVETVYIRNLAPSRVVDWVVAIHGMNTSGAWQEAFTWRLATTWGRSVPVAVYKYGIVIAGVMMTWRRRKLQNDLRSKLAALRDEARAQGFSGKPDVIAHSFGTWLLGHLIENELTREPEDRLKFGRIILTGCVLRPDFDWKRIKDADLVDDVLNHYGSKDPIVLLAHATIWDSGPSGRRGFDGDQVFNVRADGCGHSDLFSIDKCVVFSIDKGVVHAHRFQGCSDNPSAISHLEDSYKRFWRPFLTLPRQELGGLPDRADPATPWRQLPWLLRGTVFPFAALPLLLAVAAFLIAGIGGVLWKVSDLLAIVAGIGAITLALMLAAIAVTALCRRLCK